MLSDNEQSITMTATAETAAQKDDPKITKEIKTTIMPDSFEIKSSNTL